MNTEEQEKLRSHFEDKVFQAYFISCVQKDLTLRPGSMKTQAEFCMRDPAGEYFTPFVGSAWWGFCIGFNAGVLAHTSTPDTEH